MREIIIFLISLVLPFFYYRSLYYIYRDYFRVSGLRASSGLQIHHIHYGAVFLLIASLLVVFIGKNNYVVALLGFGLGLVLDEFVPALLMPWNRKVELRAYEKGFIPTLLIFLAIAAITIFASILF